MKKSHQKNGKIIFPEQVLRRKSKYRVGKGQNNFFLGNFSRENWKIALRNGKIIFPHQFFERKLKIRTEIGQSNFFWAIFQEKNYIKKTAK